MPALRRTVKIRRQSTRAIKFFVKRRRRTSSSFKDMSQPKNLTEGQHPLTGQRAANFRLLANANQ